MLLQIGSHSSDYTKVCFKYIINMKDVQSASNRSINKALEMKWQWRQVSVFVIPLRSLFIQNIVSI